MAQSNCTWHIAWWQISDKSWFAICRRYAEGLTLFAAVSLEEIKLHPAEKMTMGDLTILQSVSQLAVPPLLRARLRADLDEKPCSFCRCLKCASVRYARYSSAKAIECSKQRDSE